MQESALEPRRGPLLLLEYVSARWVPTGLEMAARGWVLFATRAGLV